MQETPLWGAVRALERQNEALTGERAYSLDLVGQAIGMVERRSSMGALTVLRQLRKVLKKKTPTGGAKR